MGQSEIIWNIKYGKLYLINPLFIRYVLFCFLEFGIFYVLLDKKYGKEPFYIISFMSLILIPWYKGGISNDFAMRASIPSLIILMIYVSRYFIEKGFKTNRDLRGISIAVCIAVGAITPSQEIIRSINVTLFKTRKLVTDDFKTFSTINENKLRDFNTFIAIDPKETFFFKNLSRME